MAYMRATHRCSGTKVECDQLVIHRRILFLDEKSSMSGSNTNAKTPVR